MASIFEFKKAIERKFVQKHLKIEPWSGATRRSANVLEISTKPVHTVLYVKISNSNPGFWGLTRNQLDRLNSLKIRWYAVLVARSSNNGYVFSSEEVNSRIEDGTFELSSDGDHKINENTDCCQGQSFQGLSKLIALIL